MERKNWKYLVVPKFRCIFAALLASKWESDGGTTVENCFCIEVFEIKSLGYHKQCKDKNELRILVGNCFQIKVFEISQTIDSLVRDGDGALGIAFK